MDLLEIDGTSVLIINNSLLSNEIYKDLRKNLIENFNIEEIIEIPSDNNNSSIIIFKNSKEKTTNIKFSKLNINKHIDEFKLINENIFLTASKNDIKNIEETLIVSIPLEELIENNYSLIKNFITNKKIDIFSELLLLFLYNQSK